MRLRPYGPEAWLIDGIDAPAAWANALADQSPPGVVEIVPAEGTVVVRCERRVHDDLGGILDSIAPNASIVVDDEPVTIDVVYDGDDLADVAEAIGSTVADVVDLHVAGEYTVAFCGFSPGFAYLTGLDRRLRLPRRSSPRTAVPAGSVAIAAGYTSVYPSESPGGWHLIGRTTQRIWDVDRRPPALLRPGATVRFRNVAT